jgi:CRP-like cAMP-binding protein/predicted metal-dependent hydrolase
MQIAESFERHFSLFSREICAGTSAAQADFMRPAAQDLFAKLIGNGARRDAFVRQATVREIAAGESVVVEGQTSASFYLVLDGQLEVSMAGNGTPKVLGTLRAGDWFGEEAALRNSPRSASVRSVGPARCIEISREVFEASLLADPDLRATLLRHADVRLAERSLRSLAFFSDLDPDEEIDGIITRRAFDAGEVIFEAGTAPVTMGFLLEGVARVPADRPCAAPLRFGPGQCIGERDVLRGDGARQDHVVAETAGVLLEVLAARFREWMARDRELADWVGTLQHIYRLPDRRLLSVYSATVDGWPCAVTVYGDPSTDGVTTTDRIGDDHLVIARCRAGAVEERVRFEGDDATRELGLANVVRNPRGEVKSGDLVEVTVRKTGPDVGQLYRRIVTGSELSARDLSRFRRTGHLGGTTRPQEKRLLCQCLQIAPEDVAEACDVETVQRTTGAGLVCGGCRPAIEALVTLRVPRTQEARPVSSKGSGCPVPSVRPHTFSFDRGALETIRAVPETILIAVTSLLSTPAERLIIATLGEAAPRIADPDLTRAIEAFLCQESNHITAHAPLNAMLVGEIYPYATRLRRLGDEMLARFGHLPLKERLAVAAAYEYASDCIFGAVYDRHYREGRRFHRDPKVHAAMLASGVGPLFSWHALEELGHRHVAFEAARALGVGHRELRRGMLRVVSDLARLQFPAILQLLRHEPDASVLGFARAVFVDPGFVRTFGLGLLRFLRRDFDPSKEDYDFIERLAGDVDRASTSGKERAA